MCQSGAYSVPANVSRDNILNCILHIGPDILCALVACQLTYMWAHSKEVIQGSHTLICISNTHSYLQGDYYIAYYIILIIGTNHTLYHKLIHCLYTIPINQKVTMRYVLNMGIPTRRYLISPY